MRGICRFPFFNVYLYINQIIRDMTSVKFYTEELINKDEVLNFLHKVGIDGIKDDSVDIIPVKSFDKTSFVDGICEVYIDETLVHKLVVEITQTTDKDSRNTSAYQRISKFIFAKKYLPDYEQIMYFTNKYISSTNTSQIGLSMLTLMGVKVINADFKPLSFDELVVKKNEISFKNPANIPYTVEVNNEIATISVKLKNGNGWSDPGVGFVTTMMYLLSENMGINKFKVINHQMSNSKLKVTKNKFRKFVSLFDFEVSFQGSDVIWTNSDYQFNPSKDYYTILEDGEKLSMINFHDYLKQNEHTVLFTNIAGCERSKLLIDGKTLTFPKSMKIPDLITYKNGQLYFFEGECDYNIKCGLEQIKGFGPCQKYVLENMEKTPTNVYIGVITDKRVDMSESNYFGYFLNKNDYLLKDGIIY